MNKAVSIVLPAYNEEKRIQQTIDSIISFAKAHLDKHEIIVVDDCSTDSTGAIVQACKHPQLRYVKNKINKGKGYSVRRGVLQAKMPFILFSDSDLATPIEELLPMLAAIQEGYDVVIASRNMKASQRVVKQPAYRQLLGQVFPLLVNLTLCLRYKDTQCGFKLFTKRAGKTIFKLVTIERWAFDAEALFIAKKKKFLVKEIPVSWYDGGESKVHVVRDSIRMCKDILTIRYNQVKRRYSS
jgi:glycosyltransferase involved in cell wall biosynthesis